MVPECYLKLQINTNWFKNNTFILILKQLYKIMTFTFI